MSYFRRPDKPYSEIMRGIFQRYLSLVDRNPLSSTYGCADRAYWHYRSLTDFPSAVYQQGVLAVAHAASAAPYDFDLDRRMLTELAQSLARFWAHIQHPDGSFAEYYENQPSFCATAFTAFAVSGAMLELRKANADDFDQASRVHRALGKAVDWLITHPNTESGNQMAASLAAVSNLGVLTGDRLQRSFEKQLDLFLSLQTEEGWWLEYGGADVGYSFKVLDLIAHVLRYRPSDSLQTAARKLLGWLEWFIHPDGTAGGVYGERSNPHLLPFGIEWFARQGEDSCRWMRRVYRHGLLNGTAFNPLSVDDKYLAYFYINSFALAATLESGSMPSHDSFDKARREVSMGESACRLHLKWWPLSKLAIVKGMGWYVVCALGKGGVIVGYQGDKRVISDAGWFLQLDDGSVWSTQAQGSDFEARAENQSVHLRCTAGVRRFSNALPLCRWSIPFRLFCRTIMRVPYLAWILEEKIRRNQVRQRLSYVFVVERSIDVSGDHIRICDTLKTRTKVGVLKAVIASDAVHPHGHCTRFFESFNIRPDLVLTPEQLAEINTRGCLSLERTVGKAPNPSDSSFSSVEIRQL